MVLAEAIAYGLPDRWRGLRGDPGGAARPGAHVRPRRLARPRAHARKRCRSRARPRRPRSTSRISSRSTPPPPTRSGWPVPTSGARLTTIGRPCPPPRIGTTSAGARRRSRGLCACGRRSPRSLRREGELIERCSGRRSASWRSAWPRAAPPGTRGGRWTRAGSCAHRPLSAGARPQPLEHHRPAARGQRAGARVEWIRASSDEAAHWSAPIDFLFIDGDHAYEAVTADSRTGPVHRAGRVSRSTTRCSTPTGWAWSSARRTSSPSCASATPIGALSIAPTRSPSSVAHYADRPARSTRDRGDLDLNLRSEPQLMEYRAIYRPDRVPTGRCGCSTGAADTATPPTRCNSAGLDVVALEYTPDAEEGDSRPLAPLPGRRGAVHARAGEAAVPRRAPSTRCSASACSSTSRTPRPAFASCIACSAPAARCTSTSCPTASPTSRRSPSWPA